MTSAELKIYLSSQIELGTSEIFMDEPGPLMVSAPKPMTPPPPKAVLHPEVPEISFEAPERVNQSAPIPLSVPAPQTPTSMGLLLPEGVIPATKSLEADLLDVEAASTLEAFHEAVMHHPYYRLGISKPGKIAFGSGPLQSPLMLVGNYPSEEDLRTEAFLSGPAAELLRKLLESLQHSRNLCYTTWFVKKPLLAPPLPRQVSMLRRMLAAEVRLVKPGMVLLLGESVFRNVIGTTASLMDEGGKAFEFASTPTTAIVEPALMLAQPQLKTITWKTHLPRSGFFRMQST
jgi:uracil-DNA glycosylase family 4